MISLAEGLKGSSDARPQISVMASPVFSQAAVAGVMRYIICVVVGAALDL